MTNKELRQAWIRALRSGDYKQGHDYLKNGDDYCCLGVLCDVITKNPSVGPGAVAGSVSALFHCERTLPLDVCDVLGVTPNPDTGIEGRGIHDGNLSLANLNDSGFTFDEIADIIDSHIRFRGEQ